MITATPSLCKAYYLPPRLLDDDDSKSNSPTSSVTASSSAPTFKPEIVFLERVLAETNLDWKKVVEIYEALSPQEVLEIAFKALDEEVTRRNAIINEEITYACRHPANYLLPLPLHFKPDQQIFAEIIREEATSLLESLSNPEDDVDKLLMQELENQERIDPFTRKMERGVLLEMEQLVGEIGDAILDDLIAEFVKERGT